MNDLAGRVAVVTGGSGGIGRVIISAMESAGAIVVNLDIKDAYIVCDVRDDTSIRDAIAQVRDARGAARPALSADDPLDGRHMAEPPAARRLLEIHQLLGQFV